MFVLECIIIFLLWTLMIYWCHRSAHKIPVLKQIHFGHHKFIINNDPPKWKLHNLWLWQDNFVSTVDNFIIEVIPTLIFCYLTGHWWIAIFFYLWSAFLQEEIEHNPKFNVYPFMTSGKWHLVHHFQGPYNFGIFTSIWDKMFGTFKQFDNE